LHGCLCFWFGGILGLTRRVGLGFMALSFFGR
jgi:hypothetical protein